MLTTHLHQAPKLKMSEAIPLLPHTHSWCGQGQIYRLQPLTCVLFRFSYFINPFISVLRKIFGSKRGEVTGEWRRIHNEELYDPNSSPNVTRVIKSIRMRCAEQVARTGDRRGAYRVLIWYDIWYMMIFIHPFSILSDDRFKATSKTIPPHSAI